MKKNFKIEYILTLNKNKQILWADNEYKLVFKTIIDKMLRNYNGVPLEWEDIYYEFLYNIPELLKKYDSTKKITLKTFLGIQCRFFASNQCRKFSGNKHKILNNFVPFEKISMENRLRDSIQPQISIDISSLSDEELIIYSDYFLGGETISQIHRNRGITKYKINKIIQSIKSKLLSQIKN
ncbi:MAG: hypothetical protein HRT99_00990 [Mycoplasmatales bacterium]|nr:hypothetical protein [Mycoplasmatales bacterium]